MLDWLQQIHPENTGIFRKAPNQRKHQILVPTTSKLRPGESRLKTKEQAPGKNDQQQGPEVSFWVVYMVIFHGMPWVFIWGYGDSMMIFMRNRLCWFNHNIHEIFMFFMDLSEIYNSHVMRHFLYHFLRWGRTTGHCASPQAFEDLKAAISWADDRFGDDHVIIDGWFNGIYSDWNLSFMFIVIMGFNGI